MKSPLVHVLVGLLATLALAGCQSNPVRNAEPTPTTDNELAELHTRLGIGSLQQGKLELAWERLSKAIQYDPGYSTAHNAMGLVYEQLDQPDKAEQHYRRATSVNPWDSRSQNNYGRFLCDRDRYEEAQERFEAALRNTLYESPEVVHTNAGLCAKAQGHFDDAERSLRTALQINPTIPPALLGMAEVSYEKGRYLSGRGYLQRYLAVSEHTSRSLWLGIRLENQLGDDDAVSSYAMLLRSNYPDSHETQQLLDAGVQ